MAQNCTCNNPYGPPMEINFGTTQCCDANGNQYTTGADAGFENILCNGCTDCCGKAGYGRITKATEDIRKTRGVPSDGSNNRGPRGQELSFRSFDGTNQGSRNVGQMVFGYLAVGLTAFIVGYSIMKGKKKAN
jgi:hypothetical protein